MLILMLKCYGKKILFHVFFLLKMKFGTILRGPKSSCEEQEAAKPLFRVQFIQGVLNLLIQLTNMSPLYFDNMCWNQTHMHE